MCKLLKLQVLTPRLEFVMHVLEQAVLLSRDLSRLVLAAVPVSLVLQLVRVQPRRFSQELVLRLFDTSSSSGRRNLARILCLMRNVQTAGGREEQAEAVN